MRVAIRMASGLLVLLLTGAAASHVLAQEPFYKDKTLRLIISVGVAGGFGEYARTLAEHLGRHLPGHPHVIVQSMPGAAGIIATNHIYVQAPQDGTVIGMILATAPLAPLWGSSRGARFDTMKFNWIGALNRVDGACTFWHTSPAKTWDDLLKHQLTVGSTGAGSPMEVYAVMLNKLFGTKIKVIGGYKAGSDIDLAMQRQEIDGRCGPHLKAIRTLHPDWYDGPKFSVPIIFADKRDPEFPNTPAIMEFVKDDATRQQVDLLMVPQKLDRVILAPPNTPAARINELRAALTAVVKDPAFVSEMKKKQLPLNPTSGEEAARIYADAYASPSATIEAAKEIMGTK
jgi:tripartite-type tricarboxylate transporter receptor subunit TctC